MTTTVKSTSKHQETRARHWYGWSGVIPITGFVSALATQIVVVTSIYTWDPLVYICIIPAVRAPFLTGARWKKFCSRGKKVSTAKNYTSVDPKQFTVSKFRLKPVILISEYFCSRCGHTNHPPPPTWRETTGDNGRQDHFRAQEGGHTNQHPPPT